jgi:hypothetical protein
MKRDPRTPKEWREAVDAAEFYTCMDSARQYGLIEGGPTVNLDRCDEILKRGAELGYRPRPIEQLVEEALG